MTNWDAYKSVHPSVSITTHCAGVVRVNVSMPLLPQDEYPPQMITLTYGETKSIAFKPKVRLTGGTFKENKGIWIRADQDITVYGFNLGEWSSGTFLALPTAAVGTEYRVVSMSSSGRGGAPPSEMAIVANSDSTVVNISIPRLDKSIFFEYGGLYEEGEYIIVTLQKFETFQVQGHNDITGIRVESSRPVTLYSGSNMAAIRGKTYDHLVENLPPINSLGTQYLLTPLFPDSKEVNIIKVIATSDETVVQTRKDSTGSYEMIFLDKGGGSTEIDLPYDGYLLLASNTPVLVAQVTVSHDHQEDEDSHDSGPDLRGDPSMTLVPALDQFLPSYTFQPPTTGKGEKFDNFANIVCRTLDETMIRLNGKPLHPNVKWNRIDSFNISYTALKISSESNVLELEGRAFGAIFSGKIPYEAYSNPGGFVFINKDQEEESSIDMEEFAMFTILPLDDQYLVYNQSLVTPKPDNTSDFFEMFALNGDSKEKVSAGITVTVIVIVVVVAKVVFCMFTLKSSKI